MEYIKAKTILSKIKNAPDSWYGLTYNMNLYRGCQHQCIYCDSRSECYRIDDFTNIQIKENALEVLNKELPKKRLKGTIGTGSMNDPYMPIEAAEKLTQGALNIIETHKFPVHVITKNKLVLRDTNLLRSIGTTNYSAVSITITTADSKLGQIIEPAASTSDERFETIKKLSAEGIYCGILLTPVLPYITDTAENIVAIIEQAKKAGAKYIIGAMGMTLRDQQRDYYYTQLDKHFLGLKEKYISRYGEQYGIGVLNAMQLQNIFTSKCKELGIDTKIKHYQPNHPEQLSLF